MNQGAGVPRGSADGEQELLVCQHLRSAELEHSDGVGSFRGEGERQRDVVDPNGLRREAAVSEHWDDGGPAVQARQQPDGYALGAVDDGRPEDRVRQP